MQPTVARIVHYKLNAADATRANHDRKDRPGAVANEAREGAVLPMIICVVWPDEFGEGIPGVNGQVFLDGNDSLWVTSVREGTEPGTWCWPPRV